VFEKAIHAQLYNYFVDNNLFCPSQYGFRKLHSTMHAVLEIIDKVIHAMDKMKNPINVYMDLSKAFDTISHEILLYKLSHYGIKGTALDLIKDYMTNLKQNVEYANESSNYKAIKTGVPQGSILGPLFFIIYMNDISYLTNIFRPVIYADDITLTVMDITGDLDIEHILNEELDMVNKWLTLNKLSLNCKKNQSNVISYTTKKDESTQALHQ
jgi:retron-type reverse transcriptase